MNKMKLTKSILQWLKQSIFWVVATLSLLFFFEINSFLPYKSFIGMPFGRQYCPLQVGVKGSDHSLKSLSRWWEKLSFLLLSFPQRVATQFSLLAHNFGVPTKQILYNTTGNASRLAGFELILHRFLSACRLRDKCMIICHVTKSTNMKKKIILPIQSLNKYIAIMSKKDTIKSQTWQNITNRAVKTIWNEITYINDIIFLRETPIHESRHKAKA